MSHTLKIYDVDRKTIATTPGVRVIETYPAFIVVEVEDTLVDAVTQGRLTEDITDQYVIEDPGGTSGERRPVRWRLRRRI